MKSELVFKEIYYEISSTGQKEVNEESKEMTDVGEEEGDKNAANGEGYWRLHALLGIIGFIILYAVFFVIQKHTWVKRGEKKFKRKPN